MCSCISELDKLRRQQDSAEERTSLMCPSSGPSVSTNVRYRVVLTRHFPWINTQLELELADAEWMFKQTFEQS